MVIESINSIIKRLSTVVSRFNIQVGDTVYTATANIKGYTFKVVVSVELMLDSRVENGFLSITDDESVEELYAEYKLRFVEPVSIEDFRVLLSENEIEIVMVEPKFTFEDGSGAWASDCVVIV